MRLSWRRRQDSRWSDPVLVIVCLIVATTQMAWGVVVPVLPAYATEFGASTTQLGLVVAMFGLGRLVVNTPAGLLCARVNPRIPLLGAAAGVVACQALMATASSLGMLLALRLATGLAGGMAITCGMVLIADVVSGAGRGRAMSLLQGMQLAGGAAGPALGGMSAEVFGIRAPFLLSGGLTALVLLVGSRRLLRSPLRRPVEPDGSPAPETTAGPMRRMFRDRSYWAICAVGFAVFFHRFGGTQSLVPIIAYTAAGLTVGQLGLLMGLVTLANVLMLPLAGSLSDRLGRKRVIVPGLALVALAMPAYVLSASPAWFVAATLVTGLAMGFSGPAPAAYVADIAPADGRGPAVGVYRTFGDLAAVIGPIAVGWLIDVTDYRVAVLVLAALVLLAVVIFATAARETVVRATAPAAKAAAAPSRP
ncbi:MAG TPA: MFS transporter [Kribbella sp.]